MSVQKPVVFSKSSYGVSEEKPDEDKYDTAMRDKKQYTLYLQIIRICG